MSHRSLHVNVEDFNGVSRDLTLNWGVDFTSRLRSILDPEVPDFFLSGFVIRHLFSTFPGITRTRTDWMIIFFVDGSFFPSTSWTGFDGSCSGELNLLEGSISGTKKTEGWKKGVKSDSNIAITLLYPGHSL